MLKVKNKAIVTFLMSSLLCLFALTENSLAGSRGYFTNESEELPSGHESANYYCSKAEESPSPDREANLLLCANAFLKVNKNKEAKEILGRIKSFSFEGKLLTFKQLVDARYALNTDNPSRALTLLKEVTPENLSLPLGIEYRDLLARAYENEGDLLQSVTERVELDGMLSDRQMADQNNAQIWATLQQINLRSLKAAAHNTENHVLKGWLELALIDAEMNSRDPQAVNTLATWKSNFRGHPGESLLPESISESRVPEMEVNHIALLLPLTGKLAGSADAIRDGFIAASQLGAEKNGAAPRISVIDTQEDQEVSRAYESALSQGADMIVGPLTKAGVEQIIKLASDRIPILALNTIDERTPSNVFQFGLSPEDEARQAAERAWQDGHHNALIIAQSGDWGERITKAFEDRWESLGGRVVDTTFYSPDQPLSGAVKSALHIDSSEARAKQIREDINHPLDFEVRRRQDLDLVFMAAQSREAHQIPPLLAFYFAHDVPVYATSSIYSGHPNPISDKDLNGVTFCDIPWNVDTRPEESSRTNPILALWPSSSQSQQRLYALGADAFEVVALLPRLEALPNFTLNGTTGRLSLDPNRRIIRALRCTKFVSGEPKRLGSHG